MKKIFFILSIFILISVPCFSQIHFGLRAGVNTHYFKLTEVVTPDYRVTVPKDATTGYHLGVVSQVNISDFFFQPELIFSSGRNDIIVRDIPGEDELEVHKFSNLNLPLIIGYKIGALKLQAGPVGSVLLSSKADLLEEKGIEQNLKSMTFGYQVGLGFDLGKLALDVKYEGNLSKFGDGLEINGNEINFDQRTSQLVFSIGLFLF